MKQGDDGVLFTLSDVIKNINDDVGKKICAAVQECPTHMEAACTLVMALLTVNMTATRGDTEDVIHNFEQFMKMGRQLAGVIKEKRKGAPPHKAIN